MTRPKRSGVVARKGRRREAKTGRRGFAVTMVHEPLAPPALEHDRFSRTGWLANVLRERVLDMAFQRGLLVLGAGENNIRLCPPLVITRDQCDFALKTLEECLTLAAQ